MIPSWQTPTLTVLSLSSPPPRPLQRGGEDTFQLNSSGSWPDMAGTWTKRPHPRCSRKNTFLATLANQKYGRQLLCRPERASSEALFAPRQKFIEMKACHLHSCEQDTRVLTRPVGHPDFRNHFESTSKKQTDKLGKHPRSGAVVLVIFPTHVGPSAAWCDVEIQWSAKHFSSALDSGLARKGKLPLRFWGLPLWAHAARPSRWDGSSFGLDVWSYTCSGSVVLRST